MHPQCENTICIIVLPTHEHWPTDVSRIPSDVITPLVDRSCTVRTMWCGH